MLRQWSLPNYFASKTQKISLLHYFSQRYPIKNSSGQMRQISRKMEMIHPTIGWRRDEHGTHKHAHGSCMDSLTCITCSLENNALSVLHYVMFALHYSMLHRFEIFSSPGTIAHGSIRLSPRNLASSRGCLLAIIIIITIGLGSGGKQAWHCSDGLACEPQTYFRSSLLFLRKITSVFLGGWN